MKNSKGLLRTAAVLQVTSRTMRPMMDFFVKQLGFTVGAEAGDGSWFATLDRDGQTIMLNCTSQMLHLRRVKGWAVYSGLMILMQFTPNLLPMKPILKENHGKALWVQGDRRYRS